MSQGGNKKTGGTNKTGPSQNQTPISDSLDREPFEEFQKCFRTTEHNTAFPLQLLRQICEKQGRIVDEAKKVEFLLDIIEMYSLIKQSNVVLL
jgi:hypothetical protein